MRSAFPADLSDLDGQKRVQSIYLNSVASAMSHKCKPLIQQFKKPNDTTAERIAQEIVAQFISNHLMQHTANTLEAETQNCIRIRHDQSWLARKLKLDDELSIAKQILDCVCPQ